MNFKASFSMLLVWLCLHEPAAMAESTTAGAMQTAAATGVYETSDRILAKAFRTGRSEFPIRCRGRVVRLLADDTEGIRHQRFIIRLSTGQTLLIVHNIDLAERIAGLALRNRVVVKGEYIWNSQGGLIHYTHRDPDGDGFHGFVRHKRLVYR